jgi:peptidoglycan/xylan/chitin deacetylase (PgdA/CDA1 family)
VTILCYHAVDTGWESPLSVRTADFETQCRWLARRTKVVAIDEALRRLRPSGSLPRGCAALTFDDGYESVHQSALPVLVRLGLPAVVFLVADTFVDPDRSPDWLNGAESSASHTLSLDQALEMQDAGVTFGSHSYSHRDLTMLPHEECLRDLKGSRELLEDLLGRRVDLLAYPRGLHDASVRQAAKLAGFRHAFGTIRPGFVDDRMAIPRAGVYRDDGRLTFAMKCLAWYPRAGRAKKRVAAILSRRQHFGGQPVAGR